MYSEKIFNKRINRIILSKPSGNYTRVEILRNDNKYQASAYTAKQVFHSNHDEAGIREFIDAHFGVSFLHYTAWCEEYEYSARVSKKGKLLESRKKRAGTVKAAKIAEGSFDRQKNHIIREGENIPALADIGVFTKELKVAAAMSDKFHQMNRFLELLADETKTLPPETTINIIDFGCGKSYLTFVVYYYFSKMKNFCVNICGLDLNAEIVKKCTEAAEKYGYDTLVFRQGDIGAQTVPPLERWGAPQTFNIVISLHACDTATDYALFNGVKWGADLICAVPCCQHELRNQMQPQTLKLFSEYGIIKERIASLATDAIRAKLLEACGYRAQIIEFTAMEHTAKNLFIRAKKNNFKINKNHFDLKMEEIGKIMQEFSFKPTFYRLLEKKNDTIQTCQKFHEVYNVLTQIDCGSCSLFPPFKTKGND
jgi:hypothetical protein